MTHRQLGRLLRPPRPYCVVIRHGDGSESVQQYATRAVAEAMEADARKYGFLAVRVVATERYWREVLLQRAIEAGSLLRESSAEG